MSDNPIERPEPTTNWGKWLRYGGIALALAAVVTVAVTLTGDRPKPKPPHQQTMRVVLPPPPPPKPPEPEKQKPLEQPKDMQPTSVSKPMENKPQQKPNPAPATAPLTAAAGAGANAYGLAVGNGSGGGIGGGGGGGGGGGSKFGAYAGQLQAQIEAALQRDEKTRRGKYALALRLWLSPSGQVQRAQIVATTGDPLMDQEVVRVLSALVVGTPPPSDMPQPVNLRVRARST